MKLYDISGEQFSAMDAPRHLMTEEGTAQTTLDRSLGICQVAEHRTRHYLDDVDDSASGLPSLSYPSNPARASRRARSSRSNSGITVVWALEAPY